MSTLTQCRLARPAQIYPPAWLDGLIMASSQNAKAEFYTVSQTKPDVTFLRQIGQAQLTLAMQRNDAAFEPGTFRVSIGASSKDLRLRGELVVK